MKIGVRRTVTAMRAPSVVRFDRVETGGSACLRVVYYLPAPTRWGARGVVTHPQKKTTSVSAAAKNASNPLPLSDGRSECLIWTTAGVKSYAGIWQCISGGVPAHKERL